jgi:hypothetical protein
MTNPTPEKKESLLLNLALNIVIPTLILTKLSAEEYLGPQLAIVVALAFPLGYGFYDFVQQKKVNFFSALGVVSVLLTGGISLLKLPAEYIAIKEAAIPALFGIAVLASIKTKFPLVKVFLFNEKLMRVDRINEALEKSNNRPQFDTALINASFIIAASFFLSSALNYILAKIILISPPGTAEYTAELGQMTAYSYIVITIPSISVLIIAMVYLFRRVTKLTSLKFEELLNDPSTR